MKVEKINSNKAKILLTLAELKEHQITPKDIEEGTRKAQEFLIKVFENSQLAGEYKSESSQLLIEVSHSNNNLFTIIITKMDYFPDVSSFSKDKCNSFSYTVSSNYYCFRDISELYLFCKKSQEESLYVGTNSLYMLNGLYFLRFTSDTIKSPQFVRTFSVLSEYACKYYSSSSFKLAFQEYSKLLLSKSAIQTILSLRQSVKS